MLGFSFVETVPTGYVICFSNAYSNTIFEYNSHRTVKTVNGETIYSLYSNDNLLGEYDSTGKVLREYAYADGQRLAMFIYKQVGGTGRGNEGQPAGQETRRTDKNVPPGQEKTPPGQEKKGEHLASLPNLPDKIIGSIRISQTFYCTKKMGLKPL